jgi:hypothetical protein
MLKLKRGKKPGKKRWEYKKGSEKGKKKGYCENSQQGKGILTPH